MANVQDNRVSPNRITQCIAGVLAIGGTTKESAIEQFKKDKNDSDISDVLRNCFGYIAANKNLHQAIDREKLTVADTFTAVVAGVQEAFANAETTQAASQFLEDTHATYLGKKFTDVVPYIHQEQKAIEEDKQTAEQVSQQANDLIRAKLAAMEVLARKPYGLSQEDLIMNGVENPITYLSELTGIEPATLQQQLLTNQAQEDLSFGFF